jgi:hypothetical protein
VLVRPSNRPRPGVPEDSDLPFTDSGKIDKRRLSALLAERIAG